MTEYAWIDRDGTERLRGTIDPAPSGFTPVTVFLRVTVAMDIHTAAEHPIDWDQALDDPWSFNPLPALPAGLGITTAIDGTDGTLTTTEAGVWAFTLVMGVAADATWTGKLHLDDNTTAGATIDSAAGVGALATVSETVKYPAGAINVPTIVTTNGATANPFGASPVLEIVRLA